MFPQQQAKQRRSLENISVVAVIATIIIALFAFIPSSTIPLMTLKNYLLATGTLISLAIFIVARLSRGNIILPPFKLVLALCLPAIAYALSSTFSSAPFPNSFWGFALEPDTLGFILIVTVLGILTALSVRNSDHYRSFVRAGAFAFGIFVFLEILFVVIGQLSPNTVSPVFSLIGSISNLAFLSGLGVIGILITFRFIELPKRAHRALAVICLGALFILAFANSQIVWTLLALVSLGLFVEAVMQRGPKTSDEDLDETTVMSDNSSIETAEDTHSLIVPLIVLIVSMFFLIGGVIGGALADTLNVKELNVRPSWQSTFVIANNSYSNTPIFGSGPGTFREEWLKYRDSSLNMTAFWDIDFSSGIGFIPTSFVTTGIVGVIAWVIFLGLLIVLGMRTLILRAPENQFIRYVAILSFIGSLYLFLIAIFDAPNSVILALSFVFVGLFISTTRFAHGGGQWGVIFSRSPRLGFVIVFFLTILLLSSVVAAYNLARRSIAVVEFARANSEFSSGDLDFAGQLIQKSISFAPNASVYQADANIAIARLGQILASSTMPATLAQQEFQKALSAGINSALTATQLAPSDYQNWITLGNLYAQAVPLNVDGAYDSAKTAYEKAKSLNPTSPQIPYIIAQLNIAHKDNKSAQDELKSAIALKQDYTDAIFLLSQLEIQDGNVKDALASALSAAYFSPNDPSILFQVGILYMAQNDLTNASSALEASVSVNPQFANARYFLAAVYAKKGEIQKALEQIQIISDMSSDNASAVATQLASLKEGKNPFPDDLFSSPSATPEVSN